MAKRRKKQPELYDAKDPEIVALSPEAQEAVERLSPAPRHPLIDAVLDGDKLQRLYSVRGVPDVALILMHRSFGDGANELVAHDDPDALGPSGPIEDLTFALNSTLRGKPIDAATCREAGAIVREWRKGRLDADPAPDHPGSGSDD